MQNDYFSKFPLITYDNFSVVNITERAVIRNFPTQIPDIYYQYDIRNNERPDQIADKVFRDQYMDWIVYLSNGMTDPYYDWFLRDDVFTDYIKKKYGINQIDNIIDKVLYYRNNWYTDQNLITISQYNSLPDIPKYDLAGNLYYTTAKRYYSASLTGREITNYKRKNIDEVHKTNKIVRYNVTGSGSFTSDEIVNITLGYANAQTQTFVSTVSGQAQVLTSNSSSLTVQHTSGFVDSVPAGYIFTGTSSAVVGRESKTNKSITQYSTLATNISEVENIFWSPVTIYEHEVEKNFKNKTIRVMNPGVAPQISQQLDKTLKMIL